MRKNAPGQQHRAAEHVFADSVKSQLQGRYLGGLVSLGDQMWRAILLRSGRMLVRTASTEIEVLAPAIAWRPPMCADERFYLCAGSRSEQVIINDIALANVIGHKPEAAALRVYLSQPGVHQLDDSPLLLAKLVQCMEALHQEFENKKAGSESIIEAQIKVMLVLLWREFLPNTGESPAIATRALILLKFRQSVETHFRDRWTVAQHAKALNVSADRLHAICSDTLGKSPQQLIHNRLAHEARILLERSEMTLDQLSVYLGFKNSPQFSVFFKSHYSIPPGRYRHSIRQNSLLHGSAPESSFADWP